MLTLRAAEERGYAHHGWLETYHTFSFANYYDPNHMGFSVLRVINQDSVAPGHGFSSHGHQNMEIISYVLSGALAHRDNLGNHSVIHPCEVQRMTAGSGIVHSEYNASKTESMQFLQIWLVPNETELTPSYEQKRFEFNADDNEFRLIVAPNGEQGAVTIHQDARLYLAHLNAGATLTFTPSTGRDFYLHIVRGQVRLNNLSLRMGDGVKIQQESSLEFTGIQTAELLLFDLPLQRNLI